MDEHQVLPGYLATSGTRCCRQDKAADGSHQRRWRARLAMEPGDMVYLVPRGHPPLLLKEIQGGSVILYGSYNRKAWVGHAVFVFPSKDCGRPHVVRRGRQRND